MSNQWVGQQVKKNEAICYGKFQPPRKQLKSKLPSGRVHRVQLILLIAALIFSDGYYSAPFLQFKEFELFWCAVFLRLEEEYWRSPFFKSILLEWILKREMKHEKNLEPKTWNLQVIVHTAVFERARNWCVKKFSLSDRNLFTCGFQKQFFFANFDGYEVWLLWYCISFRLVLVGIEGFK